MQQSEVSLSEEESSLNALVRRLLHEHREFSSQTDILDQSIGESQVARMTELFLPLREALMDHMLVEESVVFPEVSRRGLFTERASEIMQRHLEITAALENMRCAPRGKDLCALRKAFDELSAVMKLHFPAEEQEVFSLVA